MRVSAGNNGHHTDEEKSISYAMDGIVIKVNEFSLHDVLGYSNHTHKWAIAYKYNYDSAIGILSDIKLQIGRTGAITPMAVLQYPGVTINNVNINRITLHNEDQINKLGLSVGDKVIINRAGDVIPQIIDKVREGNEIFVPYEIPSRCPVCNSPVKQDELHNIKANQSSNNVDNFSVVKRCTGEFNCVAQRIQRLEYVMLLMLPFLLYNAYFIVLH